MLLRQFDNVVFRSVIRQNFPMSDMKIRRALVTGASEGIGRSIAGKLADLVEGRRHGFHSVTKAR